MQQRPRLLAVCGFCPGPPNTACHKTTGPRYLVLLTHRRANERASEKLSRLGEETFLDNGSTVTSCPIVPTSHSRTVFTGSVLSDPKCRTGNHCRSSQDRHRWPSCGDPPNSRGDQQ